MHNKNPHLYHRILCALIGIRISEVGRRSAATPALILSNHVSWLDICVITALAPVVFVAKSEVARWPLFGWLAKLQRTIFINRQARHQPGAATRKSRGRAPRNPRPAARRRRRGAVRRGHFEQWHSRAAVPLLAGRRGPSRARRD